MFSFLQKIFPGNSHEDSARALYEAIVEQSRAPAFYQKAGVPDTVEGRFDLLLLHCFLVLRRLKRDREATKDFSQTLFDTFVYHLDQSVRVSGVGDLKVGPRLKVMIESFYGRIAAYEEALPKGEAALGEALKRNLFASTEHLDEAQISHMASYTIACASQLDRQRLDDLLAGRVTFVEIDAAKDA